jgi:transposase
VAVGTTNRAMSEVAKDYDVAWWTVHRVLIAAAADAVGPAEPTTTIGIDETRARSVRWLLGEVGWRRTDRWMTSIVDLDPGSRGGIIGPAPGRSGACVEGWLTLQSNDFRAQVQVVAIDPSAPYAAGIRRALPHARIVLDHFHLVMLANQALTDVRQRVAHEQHGRRGRKTDPAWAHRRLLLRAGDTLSPAALTRLEAVLISDDPSGELSAAWAVNELLRQLLQAHGPTRYSRHETAHRRTRFLTADMPETTRLASSIVWWWPEIEALLGIGVTNARTEGHNRVIKQVKRVACGFRNQANYERRIMLHSAARRPREPPGSRPTPLKCEEPTTSPGSPSRSWRTTSAAPSVTPPAPTSSGRPQGRCAARSSPCPAASSTPAGAAPAATGPLAVGRGDQHRARPHPRHPAALPNNHPRHDDQDLGEAGKPATSARPHPDEDATGPLTAATRHDSKINGGSDA